jgi:hypothetical protein
VDERMMAFLRWAAHGKTAPAVRLDPTTAAGVDSPMGAALALLADRDVEHLPDPYGACPLRRATATDAPTPFRMISPS